MDQAAQSRFFIAVVDVFMVGAFLSSSNKHEPGYCRSYEWKRQVYGGTARGTRLSQPGHGDLLNMQSDSETVDTVEYILVYNGADLEKT